MNNIYERERGGGGGGRVWRTVEVDGEVDDTRVQVVRDECCRVLVVGHVTRLYHRRTGTVAPVQTTAPTNND